jgi:predicted DNA binding CopG/RHH family protein
LEESFLIKSLLSNPEDKSVAKNVAQKIQKFYFRDKSNRAAISSSAIDVRINIPFCSHSTKFSIGVQLGSLTVREK